MSNGDDLTYENEIRKIRVSLTDVEDAKKVADNLMIKKVEKYEAQIKDLKKEIDRLSEENRNFQIISKSHKEINGDLQTKLSKAELKIKELEVKLKEQVNQFRNKGDL